MKNDFEKIVFPKFPVLEEMKKTLYNSGAKYASMTGTGSTLYAIYKNDYSENFPVDPT